METENNAIDGVNSKSHLTLNIVKIDRTLRSKRSSDAAKENNGKTIVNKTASGTRERPASSETAEIRGEALSTELTSFATNELSNGIRIEHEGEPYQKSNQEIILSNKYDSQQAQEETGAAAEPGACTESPQVEDILESNTNHFTRSKRSSRTYSKSNKYSTGIKRKSDRQGNVESPLPNINECADILARIDEDSYNQDLLQDANKILEGNVFPMCFPWQHPVVPLIKNIARDIDEMYPFLHCQDEIFAPFENGSFDYGKFEIGNQTDCMTPKSLRKRLKATKHRAASRRGYDPGILELTVMEHPHMFLESSPFVSRNNNNLSSDLATEGSHTQLGSIVNKEIQGHGTTSKADDQQLHRIEIEDITYRSFEKTQREKKRKLDLAKAYASKKLVSVRVGSVSTRSSVFYSYKSNGESQVIFAQAQMPLEVATGKHVTFESAARLDKEGLASYLGSYDVRYGTTTSTPVAANKESTGRAKRTYVGRNRLMWTNKVVDTSVGSGSQRHIYMSLLTRSRLESASLYKRPREVKVAVRINGTLLAIDERIEISLRSSDKEGEYSELGSSCNPQIIANAIERACGQISSNKTGSPEEVRKTICTLDSDKYLKDLFSEQQQHGRNSFSMKTPKPPSCSKALTGFEDDGFVKCKSPRIECLPLSEGSMRVVCCSPGSIKASTIGSFLNHQSRISVERLCSICWSRADEEKHLPIHECFECGLIVHLDCCFDPGTKLQSEGSIRWRCAVCSHMLRKESPAATPRLTLQRRKQRRATKVPIRFQTETNPEVLQKKAPNRLNLPNSYRCAKCPFSGGAMSQMEMDDGTCSWVHDVCRIWNSYTGNSSEHDIDNHPLRRRYIQVCALCGIEGNKIKHRGSSTSLVRCAARGCYVMFHPMCALLSSRVHRTDEPNNADAALDKMELRTSDIYFCSQYTLTFIQCNRTERSIGKPSGRTVESLLPVALCGLHNPKRQNHLFGCPPAVKNFKAHVRVPLENS